MSRGLAALDPLTSRVVVAPYPPRGHPARAFNPESRWALLASVWLGQTLRLLKRNADSLRLIVDVEHEADGPLHDPMLRAWEHQTYDTSICSDAAMVSERGRIEFLLQRDGVPATINWVKRTLSIYRSALRSRRGYGAAYRRALIESCCDFRRWLRQEARELLERVAIKP